MTGLCGRDQDEDRAAADEPGPAAHLARLRAAWAWHRSSEASGPQDPGDTGIGGHHYIGDTEAGRRGRAARGRPRLRPGHLLGFAAGHHRVLQPARRHRRDRQLPHLHRGRPLRGRRPAGLGSPRPARTANRPGTCHAGTFGIKAFQYVRDKSISLIPGEANPGKKGTIVPGTPSAEGCQI